MVRTFVNATMYSHPPQQEKTKQKEMYAHFHQNTWAFLLIGPLSAG
jgi:hypothetical protein